MATSLRQGVSCAICLLACILSLSCFACGCAIFYLDINQEFGAFLIGFGCNLIPITTFLKSFSSSFEQSTLTEDFYYVSIFITSCIMCLSQFGIGIWWYFCTGLEIQASNLINYAINLVCINLFLKSLTGKASSSTTETTNNKIIIDDTEDKIIKKVDII